MKFIVKFYSIASLFCFLIANIFNILYTYYVKLPHDNPAISDYMGQSFWGLYNSFWSFGYTFTYLLWYKRIKGTFKNSAHDLQKTTNIIFYILLFLYIITQQFNSIVWEIFIFTNGLMTWKQFNDIYSYVLWIRLSIDFIMNIFVIYLFCSKIYKLTVIKPSATSPKSIFATEHSSHIFEAMVKYFVLTCLTVLSTEIFTASQIVLSSSINYAVNTDNYDFYFIAYPFYYILSNIDSIISTSYIMLTFPFGRKYYQFICKYPHKKCMKLWSRKLIIDTKDVKTTQECMLAISPDGSSINVSTQRNIVKVSVTTEGGHDTEEDDNHDNGMMEVPETRTVVIELDGERS